MALGQRFVCTSCSRDINVSDAGRPYYVDESGRKVHPPHPSSDLYRCHETDTPMLCLACGAERESDSAAPASQCRSCGSGEIVSTWELGGRRCPYCKRGTFAVDPNSLALS